MVALFLSNRQYDYYSTYSTLIASPSPSTSIMLVVSCMHPIACFPFPFYLHAARCTTLTLTRPALCSFCTVCLYCDSHTYGHLFLPQVRSKLL